MGLLPAGDGLGDDHRLSARQHGDFRVVRLQLRSTLSAAGRLYARDGREKHHIAQLHAHLSLRGRKRRAHQRNRLGSWEGGQTVQIY